MNEIILPLVCGCRSFPFAHSPARHRTLRHPGDWTPWQQRYSVVSGYLAEKEKQRYQELKFWEAE
jgi:hypothetical protein